MAACFRIIFRSCFFALGLLYAHLSYGTLPVADFEQYQVKVVQAKEENTYVERLQISGPRTMRMDIPRDVRVSASNKPKGIQFSLLNNPETVATLVSFKKEAFASKIGAAKLNRYLKDKADTASAQMSFEIIEEVVNDGRTSTPFFMSRQSLAMHYAYNRINPDESVTRLETAEYWILREGVFYVLTVTAPTANFTSFDSKVRSAVKRIHIVQSS